MKQIGRTWRLDVLFGILMLALLGLSVRMALLLHDDRTQALRLAEKQEMMVVRLPARPGSVLARADKVPVLLAGSKQSPSCMVDPKFIREDELGDVAIRVGKALNIEPMTLQDLFYARREARFVWLKKNISEAEMAAVQALKIPAVGIRYEFQREYPNADLAAQITGWVKGDGTPGGGLEQSQHRVLAPKDGKRVMLADAPRHPIWEIPEASRLPQDGGNVYLTIDANIQKTLQDAVAGAVEEFMAKWGVGLVVDLHTGEILAMTSISLDPATRHAVVFDPNSFNAVGADGRSNLAITVPYEPGSAGKTPYAAAAVNLRMVDWDTVINCEGGVWHSPRGGTISDHGAHYGALSVFDIVVHSSNIGMGKIGEKCGNDILFKIATDYGFGKRTGIELPGESPGILRDRKKWDGYSTIRVPFGQEISTTALQLAMAYCALANGGELLKPRIIDYITDANGNVTYRSQRQVARRVISPGVSKGAIAAMQGVVENEGGTGANARSHKWTTFGKTGTAQIPSTTPGHAGYVEGAFTGTFVGGAPAGDPKIICLVSIFWPRQKGHFGATVAAPAWKTVVEKTLTYLNVPQDRNEPETPARGGGRTGSAERW